MVKRIKEVPSHLAEEIRWAGKIFGGPLNLWEVCECETRKEGMADKRTGPSAIELDLGVPTA
jgi:hypothetical protein